MVYSDVHLYTCIGMIHTEMDEGLDITLIANLM